MEIKEISIDINNIAERAYSYVSKIASRISSDGNSFEKSSLTRDDDPFMVHNTGLIRDVANVIESRFLSYNAIVQIKEALVLLSLSVPEYIKGDPMHYRKIVDDEPMFSRFKNLIEEYIYKSLVSRWFELLGVQQGYPSFDPLVIDSILNNARASIDYFYFNKNKTKVRPLGF